MLDEAASAVHDAERDTGDALVVAPGVGLVEEVYVALYLPGLAAEVVVSEASAAVHVVGGDERDLEQVLAEVVGDDDSCDSLHDSLVTAYLAEVVGHGLEVVDGGDVDGELQHLVGLGAGLLQERDVIRAQLAPGVPLQHRADYLHNLRYNIF